MLAWISMRCPDHPSQSCGNEQKAGLLTDEYPPFSAFPRISPQWHCLKGRLKHSCGTVQESHLFPFSGRLFKACALSAVYWLSIVNIAKRSCSVNEKRARRPARKHKVSTGTVPGDNKVSNGTVPSDNYLNSAAMAASMALASSSLIL